jgi:hypothetical protein
MIPPVEALPYAELKIYGVRAIAVGLGSILLLSITGSTPVHSRPVDSAIYEEILSGRVLEGRVDYRSIKRDSTSLISYLEALSDGSSVYYDTWSRDEQIAFWLNAYNAITIYAIISSYPIDYGGWLSRVRFPKNSIRQIKDVWSREYYELAGKPRSLDEIEHEILRREFGDPRVHFALVCASGGCPLLSDEPYAGDSLNAQIERDAHRFINNRDKVYIDKRDNTLYVSSIFEWYAEDFESTSEAGWLNEYDDDDRGFLEFIARYIDDESQEYITANTPRVIYLDYDWSLNESEIRD